MNDFDVASAGGLPGGLPPEFPTVRWKRETATFTALNKGEALTTNTVPEPAALVFPFYGDRVVLADIAGRGWCIPSGHIEPGESAGEAVRREAREEAGANLGRVELLGYFRLTDNETGAVRHAPTFIADVTGLVAIPPDSESRGMQLAAVEDIAGLYFSWDPLLAAVFDYAYEQKGARLRSGVSLRSLIAEVEEGE